MLPEVEKNLTKFHKFLQETSHEITDYLVHTKLGEDYNEEKLMKLFRLYKTSKKG